MKEAIKEFTECVYALFKRGTKEVKKGIDNAVIAAYLERNIQQMEEITAHGQLIVNCGDCYHLTPDEREGVKGYCTRFAVHFAMTPFEVQPPCFVPKS